MTDDAQINQTELNDNQVKPENQCPKCKSEMGVMPEHQFVELHYSKNLPPGQKPVLPDGGLAVEVKMCGTCGYVELFYRV